MSQDTLGIIGAGKMGEALLMGLVSSGNFTQRQLCASDSDPVRREAIRERYSIEVFDNNSLILKRASTVILAVKPQAMDQVLGEMKGDVSAVHLFISIAAGVPVETIMRPFAEPPRIIRVMPNICVLAQAGASVIYAGPRVTPEDLELASKIFNSVGRSFIIKDERLLDAVTGLSGSGPAYFFIFMEALADGGVAQGLPRELATELAVQTALGCAKLAAESDLHLSALKDLVTSPGGTTMAGLRLLERQGFRGMVMEAVAAGTERARELSKG